jgi:hypothetical protein
MAGEEENENQLCNEIKWKAKWKRKLKSSKYMRNETRKYESYNGEW